MKPSDRKSLLQMIADNEQDRAAGKAWFEAATFDELKIVWDFLQRDFPNPVAELCSRLAALQFATFVEEQLRDTKGRTK